MIGEADPLPAPLVGTMIGMIWRTISVVFVVALAGGLSAAFGQADDDDVQARVDRAIKAAAFGKAGTRPLDQLQPLGEKATPRLIHWLDTGHLNERRAAAYALAACWSQAARPAAKRYLGDKDHNVRELIGAALRHHEPPDVIVELAGPWVTDPNPGIAGPALDLCESVSSDAARMNRALGNRRLWNYLPSHLPRYHDPVLTDNTLKMLRAGDLDQKLAAITGLIHQHAGSPLARRLVAGAMRSPNPLIRDRCGEYFAWWGRPNDIKAIEDAIKTTRDAHALASLNAAIAMIERRNALGLNQPLPDLTDEPIDDATADDYRAALEQLNAGAYEQAYRTLALGRSYAPRYVYEGRALADDVAKRHAAREALLRALLGVRAEPRGTTPNDAMDMGELPVADKWVTPVRNYDNPKRESFGRRGRGPFDGLVHAGDDVAWHDPHETVVAVAAGQVRRVFVGNPWGGLIVIEHQRDGGGTLCSVYGQLSPLLFVEQGQRVEAGQKIGSTARAFTRESGGRAAHLHLAIHQGEYGDGTWVTGYISPEQFADGAAGWVDPQPFLKAADAE